MFIYKVIVIFLASTLILAQHLVLLGGNLKDGNAQIWNKMIELAGGKENARIGVISASSQNTTEGDKVIDNFVRLYGVKNVTCIHVDQSRVNDPAVAQLIRSQTGIFIVEDSGSTNITPNVWDRVIAKLINNQDVNSAPNPPQDVVAYEGLVQNRVNLITTLRPNGKDSLVMKAIKDLLLTDGGMVAGNCGFMSESPIILGGDSIGALLSNTSTFYWPKTPLVYYEEGGLGLLSGYILDSQLSDRGREFRLIRALLDHNKKWTKGYGIDANTALVINKPLSPQPVAVVLNAEGAESGVFYADVRDIQTYSIADGLYSNIPFSFFTVNDSLNLQTNEVTYASWKLAIAGEEWFNNSIPSSDIFSRFHPSEWRKTARRLIDCKEMNVTSFSPMSLVPWLPRIEVILDRTEAIGYGADIPDDANKTYVASYRRMFASVKVIGFL